jgi:hypothetical protein
MPIKSDDNSAFRRLASPLAVTAGAASISSASSKVVVTCRSFRARPSGGPTVAIGRASGHWLGGARSFGFGEHRSGLVVHLAGVDDLLVGRGRFVMVTLLSSTAG